MLVNGWVANGSKDARGDCVAVEVDGDADIIASG